MWRRWQRDKTYCHPSFRIGSISKVLTAAAVAKLVETGQLDLDMRVRQLVPEFPDTKVTEHDIAKRIIESHGGRISVIETDRPHGAAFVIALPRIKLKEPS